LDANLKFVFTSIREIIGITAPETGDAILINDSGTWACLTCDPTRYRKELDEGAAIATMLLRGLVGGGPEGSFTERLEKEIAGIVEERNARSKPHNYLVLRLEGEMPDWESRTEREIDQFVIRLNGAPKLGIRDRFKVELASIVVAISQRTGRPVQLMPHADGLVFFRGDGKKIYAKELIAGTPSIFVSSPWNAADQTLLQADFLALRELTTLIRVHQLFAASLEQTHDRLRAFLSGWSALEIFVNKVFSLYETVFLGGLTSDTDPKAKEWYVGRIREVMKDKYRLRDRFALIAASLVPCEADADVDDFVAAKKTRDALAHGMEVPDSDLPVEVVHKVLGKYLQLHATEGY